MTTTDTSPGGAASLSANVVLSGIEAAIRSDPALRGLLGDRGTPLGVGELAQAARSLVTTGGHSVILTGFFIPTAGPPAAETDGPPGAVALAQTLLKLGQRVTIVTDPFCASALVAATTAATLPANCVSILGEPEGLDRLLAGAEPPVRHLIAIERVGPGYTSELVRKRCGEEAAGRFADCVPQDYWSRCLNMRGLPIEEWTVDFSSAFESPLTGVTTIGLGDGGNELGLGKFPWTDLAMRLTGIADLRILCRVSADHAVIAGTSNWAGYGLAAAVSLAAGQPQASSSVTAASQQHVLEKMVREGPAVDGVTRRFEPTVDGLPVQTFLEPLQAIRELLGLDQPRQNSQKTRLA